MPWPKGKPRPEGSGRKAGKPNNGTAEIRDLARLQCPAAIATLTTVMKTSKSEANRVSASNSLLDRGIGKAVQAVHHSGEDGGPIQVAVNVTLNRQGLLDALQRPNSGD
jgi:hypothetical protein